MQVLFLDIDGVLNSSEFFEDVSKHWNRHRALSQAPPLNHVDRYAYAMVMNLMYDLPELGIVISSDWRRGRSVEQLQELFRDFRIIDRTPIHEDDQRDKEILAWLEEHPDVKDWVVVDDTPFDQVKIIEANRFVHVDDGIRPEHLNKIKEILNDTRKGT